MKRFSTGRDDPDSVATDDSASEAGGGAELIATTGRGHLRRDDEPPVVARLVVEIRSDGSRTIARGAMEDPENGHSVAVEARGDSPLQLAWALARSMFSVPSLARKSSRFLRPGSRRKK